MNYTVIIGKTSCVIVGSARIRAIVIDLVCKPRNHHKPRWKEGPLNDKTTQVKKKKG
jgi:hypothetical protein